MKAVQNFYKNIFLLDPSDNLAIPFDIVMIDNIAIELGYFYH